MKEDAVQENGLYFDKPILQYKMALLKHLMGHFSYKWTVPVVIVFPIHSKCVG